MPDEVMESSKARALAAPDIRFLDYITRSLEILGRQLVALGGPRHALMMQETAWVETCNEPCNVTYLGQKQGGHSIAHSARHLSTHYITCMTKSCMSPSSRAAIQVGTKAGLHCRHSVQAALELYQQLPSILRKL